jgi:hypothetical protein
MRYYSETRGLRDGIEVDALRVIVRDLYLDLKETVFSRSGWVITAAMKATYPVPPGVTRGEPQSSKLGDQTFGLQIRSREDGPKTRSLTFFNFSGLRYPYLLKGPGAITVSTTAAGTSKVSHTSRRAASSSIA